MPLSNAQKQILVLLGQRNPDYSYVSELSNDETFALQEISENRGKVHEELLKEKESHERHMIELTKRLDAITMLLTALEELDGP